MTRKSRKSKAKTHSRQQSRTASEPKYYYFTIDEDEKNWFSSWFTSSNKLYDSDLEDNLLKLVETERPKTSSYYVFIREEKDPYSGWNILFVCVVSSLGMNIFILPDHSGSSGFSKTFSESINVHNPRFRLTREDAQSILDAGLNPELDNSRKNYFQQLKTDYEKLSLSKKKIEQSERMLMQQQTKIINAHVNDLGKKVEKEHSDIKQLITRKRNQLIKKFVSNPSLSLMDLSKKNRPVIQQQRNKHLKQLLDKYGGSTQQVPQQQDIFYRQKIMEHRKKQEQKRQEKQRQTMKPFQKQINQYVNGYRYGNSIEEEDEKLVENVVWRNLGLTDPIFDIPIKNPIILPSKALADQISIQNILKFKKDPFTNQLLPPNTKFVVNKQISKDIRSIEDEVQIVMESSGLPLKNKIFKLIQLRNKWLPIIDQKKMA
jgi:hypothetical protein